MTGPTGRSQSSRSALAEAYENAVKSEADRKALAAVVERRRFRLRTTLLAIAWVGILGGLGVLAIHPEWFNLGQAQESPAERDANVRLTLYIAGRQLEAYRHDHAKYPDRLADAGRFAPGLVYVRTPDGGYELKLSRGSDRVTLTSRDSLNDFLKPSLSRLVHQGGN
jgi:hypothetical protein